MMNLFELAVTIKSSYGLFVSLKGTYDGYQQKRTKMFVVDDVFSMFVTTEHHYWEVT